MPEPWRIEAQAGRHTPTDIDASGWIWQLQRDSDDATEVHRIIVEVTGPAFQAARSRPGAVPDDTWAAIQTEGRSEVEKVLDQDAPPRRVQCTTNGCQHDVP